MPVVGNSIKQCSQSIIPVFKGNWGRWWHLLEVLVYLPGQTKNAKVKAFLSILITNWIFIKLPTVFKHNLLPFWHIQENSSCSYSGSKCSSLSTGAIQRMNPSQQSHMSVEGAEPQHCTGCEICCSGLKGRLKLWAGAAPKEAKETAVF